MSTDRLTHAHEGALEECLDELDEIVERLGRFPPTLVALALRLHLEALLLMLIEHGISTRQEVRTFLRDLEHHTLSEP
jgi:hypothetical protein